MNNNPNVSLQVPKEWMAFYTVQDWEKQFQLKSFNTDYPRFASPPPPKKKANFSNN